jgi:xylulokinase
MMPLLLAIDAGTTSLKAGLFNAQGECLGVERREYTLETPKVDWAQVNPEVYWQACVQAVRSLIELDGVKKEAIAALAVSSQGETILAVDDQGKPVYPAIVWLDNRAGEEARQLSDLFGEEIYQRSGIPEVIPTWSACKVLWLRNHEPQAFARSAKFLLVQDFLVSRLSGVYATDGSIACTSMFYDIRQHGWWQDVLDVVGVHVEQLPQLVKPGSVVGQINAEAAQILGLSQKTLVVSGGMDQAVGAIGSGNIQPGIISESTGAALAIQATILDTSIVEKQKIPVYVHSVPGKYLVVPVCPTAGMAFKWLRDQFCQAEMQVAQKNGMDAYDLMTKLAASVPAGSDGLVMLPHLSGAFSPNINPLARGSFSGFTLSHTRAHFIRAVMEGVAFLLKQNIDSIAAAGVTMHEIIATGGGARSLLWNQIKADVCGLPVATLKNEETALAGDAILAGVASGIFTSIEAGCRQMVDTRQIIQPGNDQESYRCAYARYLALDEELSDYFIKHYTN